MADDNSVSDMSSSSSSSADDNSPFSVKTKIKKEHCQPKARKFSVTYEKFRDLPKMKGYAAGVQSSTFSCFENEWRLQLLKDGYYDYPEPPKGTVGVALERCSRGGKWPKVKFSFEVKSPDGKTSLQTSSDPSKMIHFVDTSAFYALANRDDIKSRFLDRNGALTIYFTMELDEYIPKNPLAATMLKLFMDEESSDVIFEVSNKGKKRKRGETSSSSVQFHAHRFILEHTSSELAALCESSPEGGLNSPILINDIKTNVFFDLLWYIYGGMVTQKCFGANGRDMIDAADKYGVVNLKLEAEAWYCHNTKITTENVIDNLLYADSKNLALLKEAVMDYIVKNKKKVMKRVSFKDVPGDIYKDLLAAVSRVLDDSDEDDSDDEENEEKDEYASMGIGTLRQKLDAKGLDIDGSRDTLIAALKESS